MKKVLIGFLLAGCLLSSICVEAQSIQKNNSSWNPITIYNNTDKHIAYVMSGVYGGSVYGIEKGMTDVYHSGTGDQYATFQVGLCKSDSRGYPHGCNEPEGIKECSNGHYNADLIKTIVVNSLTSCTVTCLDGGSTTCKQSS